MAIISQPQWILFLHVTLNKLPHISPGLVTTTPTNHLWNNFCAAVT
jgi:hypothetical protein